MTTPAFPAGTALRHAPNLPAGTVQLTASASGLITQNKTVTITAGQIATLNFALNANSSKGSITGLIASAINGSAIPE